MNKFSIYQYLLILSVLVIGFLYALPNIYPTQPSIQVAYTDSGLSADQALLDDLENILEDSKTVYDEIFLRDNKIVIKFKDVETQLSSKTILQNALGKSPLSIFLMAFCTSSFWEETPLSLYLLSVIVLIRIQI